MLSRFGRIALLANLALSLVFAVWAFALWYNRIDFEAEKKNRDDVIKRFSATIQPGMSRLAATRASLQTVETKRPKLLAWYQQQLEELHTGNGPIQAVVFQKGEVQYDLEGHPLLDQPAFGIGSLISVGLGVYGRLHEPTFFALNLAGFSSGLAVKAWLATAAFGITGRISFEPARPP